MEISDFREHRREPEVQAAFLRNNTEWRYVQWMTLENGFQII